MADFRFDFEWLPYPDADPETGETTARLELYVDDLCLTRNEDVFSGTVRDHVVVSLYPLAMWFASAWWRLNHEIMPSDVRAGVAHVWRMSHELAAANMGFVWPNLVLAPDGDEIQVRSHRPQDHMRTSVRYLGGSSQPRTVPKERFVQRVSSFITRVIARLDENDLRGSDLARLWALTLEDRANPEERQKRRIEAILGFDPEECPASMVKTAIALEKRIGASSFSELSGAYAGHSGNRVGAMGALADSAGISGRPDMPGIEIEKPGSEPWRRAVSAARELRKRVGEPDGFISDGVLYELLGLSRRDIENWMPMGRAKASVAEGVKNRIMKFVPRKKHPVSLRFELTRFIGDYARSAGPHQKSWLVTADLSTARQKFQRAFAAEFLCPIRSLIGFLDDDFSESAIEDAASHFSVSERTVESLLLNNGYFSRLSPDADMTYV